MELSVARNASTPPDGLGALPLSTTQVPGVITFVPPSSARPTDRLSAWVVGGGVEYKFAPEWSLKAEYLYADLGDFKANVPFIVGVTRTSDMTLNTVRVGVNYSGPVIERFFSTR